MRRRKHDPEKISDILRSGVENNLIQLGLALMPVWQHWSAIIGKDFSSLTEISGFKRGVLYVKVNDTTLMDRLVYEKERILESIREILGTEIVQDIFFELGDSPVESNDVNTSDSS